MRIVSEYARSARNRMGRARFQAWSSAVSLLGIPNHTRAGRAAGNSDGALEDGDLLPDLVREGRRKALDLVHAGEHGAIVEPLDEERGDLADEREELAAEI